MSFTSQVKIELARAPLHAPHCKDAMLAAYLLKDDREIWERVDLHRSCCQRAFLRGLFLASGTIPDPEKGYQLEIRLSSEAETQKVAKVLENFEIPVKTIERKNHYVVYLKEGDEVSAFLALIGAGNSVLNLENIRVVRDVRNTVNRRVNCETANLQKSVSAGMTQVRQIEWIAEHIGLNELPDPLREIAAVRLQYPDVSLQELGEHLVPPVGKSGVNHRLRRLKQIYEEGVS